MLRSGVGDAVLDELAGERAGIGKRPAVQQRAEHDRRKQVSGTGVILRDPLVQADGAAVRRQTARTDLPRLVIQTGQHNLCAVAAVKCMQPLLCFRFVLRCGGRVAVEQDSRFGRIRRDDIRNNSRIRVHISGV